ncbi:hypothetical protein DUT91_05690 [Phyllobacterium salinisoli]|uniref:Uncharacterized protein n=1 Tax=Phyllobacterium salinisoli TaxID=1899321 RepID=A0A368K6C7_9HYPH|nr:hypothetical protein [Phyllobacterium salinisoli]RCS24937.1 hypothetical protein DUT91_05690 [Phyllobacterium salinisoli]
MRRMTIKMTALAAFAALPLATAAQAQQTPPAAQAPAATPAPSETQPASPGIKRVAIVDISELPAPTQEQVNAAVAKTGDEDLKALRSSIDATPQITAALKEKGVTSAQVIAANVDNDGTLTLVTKKAS